MLDNMARFAIILPDSRMAVQKWPNEVLVSKVNHSVLRFFGSYGSEVCGEKPYSARM